MLLETKWKNWSENIKSYGLQRYHLKIYLLCTLYKKKFIPLIIFHRTKHAKKNFFPQQNPKSMLLNPSYDHHQMAGDDDLGASTSKISTTHLGLLRHSVYDALHMEQKPPVLGRDLNKSLSTYGPNVHGHIYCHPWHTNGSWTLLQMSHYYITKN